MPTGSDIISRLGKLKTGGEQLEKAKGQYKKRQKLAAGMGERGRFVKKQDIKESRDYVVMLRAGIARDEWNLFHKTLKASGEDVQDWSRSLDRALVKGYRNVGKILKLGAGKGFDFTKGALRTLWSLGGEGLDKEIAAIDFGNRLGLSLPQSRIWSKVFSQMGITSFDELAEVYRNPKKRALMEELVNEQAKWNPVFQSEEVQKGLDTWNKLVVEWERTKVVSKNFVESIAEMTLGVTGVGDKLIDWSKSFKPVIIKGHPIESIQQTFEPVVSSLSSSWESLKYSLDQNEDLKSNLSLIAEGTMGYLAIGVASRMGKFLAFSKIAGLDNWLTKSAMGISNAITKVFFPALVAYTALTLFEKFGGFDWLVEKIHGKPEADNKGVTQAITTALGEEGVKNFFEGKLTPEQEEARDKAKWEAEKKFMPNLGMYSYDTYGEYKKAKGEKDRLPAVGVLPQEKNHFNPSSTTQPVEPTIVSTESGTSLVVGDITINIQGSTNMSPDQLVTSMRSGIEEGLKNVVLSNLASNRIGRSYG